MRRELEVIDATAVNPIAPLGLTDVAPLENEAVPSAVRVVVRRRILRDTIVAEPSALSVAVRRSIRLAAAVCTPSALSVVVLRRIFRATADCVPSALNVTVPARRERRAESVAFACAERAIKPLARIPPTAILRLSKNAVLGVLVNVIVAWCRA